LQRRRREYREAPDDTTKANNRALEAQKEVSEQMAELYDSLKGIGDVIGGRAGEIIHPIADIIRPYRAFKKQPQQE
jgi:hypothetical protein